MSILSLFLVLFLMITITPSIFSYSINWIDYVQVPVYASNRNSGINIDYYKPSSVTSDWTIQTALQTNLGVFYATLILTGRTVYNQIQSASSNFRPSIRQVPPYYQKNGLLTTWVDTSSQLLKSTIVYPSQDYNNTNYTLVTPDVWTVDTVNSTDYYNNFTTLDGADNSTDLITLYSYFYGSINTIYYNGQWFYIGSVLLSQSSTPPPGPGYVTLLVSNDGGKSTTIVWSLSAKSSLKIGPQITLVGPTGGNQLLGIMFVDDADPTKAKFLLQNGVASPPATPQVAYATSSGSKFDATPGVARANNNLIASLYTDSSDNQFGAFYDYRSSSWTLNNWIYGSSKLKSTIGYAMNYDADGVYYGTAFFQGNDGVVYYDEYQ